MIGALIYLAGIGTGVWLGSSLPPATPRALARERRRNRADLRHVLPAREVGARIGAMT